MAITATGRPVVCGVAVTTFDRYKKETANNRPDCVESGWGGWCIVSFEEELRDVDFRDFMIHHIEQNMCQL